MVSITPSRVAFGEWTDKEGGVEQLSEFQLKSSSHSTGRITPFEHFQHIKVRQFYRKITPNFTKNLSQKNSKLTRSDEVQSEHHIYIYNSTQNKYLYPDED